MGRALEDEMEGEKESSPTRRRSSSSATRSRPKAAREGASWLVTLFGIALLVSFGFVLGLLAGVVSQEPELVAGHLAGRSKTVEWASPAERPEEGAESAPLPAVSGGLELSDGLERGTDASTIAASRAGAETQQASAAAAQAAMRGEGADATASELARARRFATDSAGAESRAESARSHSSSQLGGDLPAVSAAPPAGGAYAIQVGAFARSQVAEQLANELARKGYSAYVSSADEERELRWRVRVGPIEGKAEADTLLRRLQDQERLPTWLVAEGR